MAYVLKTNLVASSKHSIKCPHTMVPEFFVIHNTANDATAANEISYMISNNNQTSFHYAIDDKEVIQGISTSRNAWHAGDGGSGNGNRKGIAIEICYSKSGGTKFNQAEQNAVEFVASELKKRGWGTSKIKFHRNFANKNCPHRTNDADFIKRVDAILNPPIAVTDSYVGKTVTLKGYLYTNSNGGGKKSTVVKSGTITKKHTSGSTPYLLNNGTGWLGASDFVVTGATVTVTPIAVNDTVKIKSGAYYMINGGNQGAKVGSAYVGKPYKVLEIKTLKGNSCARLGSINSWVKVSDLTK